MKPNTSAIMRAVHERLGTRRSNGAVAAAPAAPDLSAPAVQPPARVGPLDMKNNYVLSDLTGPSDREFVTRAYRAILRRDPDAEGLAAHLAGLRAGRVDKIDVLAALRWSDEGRAQDVHVDGLLAPTLLRRWKRTPVVGPLVTLAHALARLPVVLRRVERLEATLARDVGELAERTEPRLDQLDTTNRRLAEAVARLVDRSEAMDARAAGTTEELARLGAALAAAEQEAMHARTRLGHAEERLLALRAEIDGTRQEIAGLDAAVTASAARIDAIDARVDQTFAAASRREDELHFRITACQESIERLGGTERRVETLIAGVSARIEDRIDQAFAAASAREDELHFGIRACRESIEKLAAADLEIAASLGRASERLDRLESAESRSMSVGGVSSRRPVAGSPAADDAIADLDALYVAFEARFRGEPSLIRKRLHAYVPHIREANVGTPDTPVVDVGSGNGEWLELLREHDIVARGIDSNAVFAELCRARGFEVTHADAIDALSEIPGESIGAVTAFHIAEHLPFEILVSLIDNALRVLRPGGLLILETPNPENLLVGSCYFYTDPTHRNPLPPETLRWLVESRGFRRTQIQRLSEWRDVGAPPPVDESVQGAAAINAMIARFAAAPDYAITARKL